MLYMRRERSRSPFPDFLQPQNYYRTPEERQFDVERRLSYPSAYREAGLNPREVIQFDDDELIDLEADLSLYTRNAIKETNEFLHIIQHTINKYNMIDRIVSHGDRIKITKEITEIYKMKDDMKENVWRGEGYWTVREFENDDNEFIFRFLSNTLHKSEKIVTRKLRELQNIVRNLEFETIWPGDEEPDFSGPYSKHHDFGRLRELREDTKSKQRKKKGCTKGKKR